MPLFDHTILALNQALGAAGLRQQVLANNLSNANTPGFKRSDVSFQEALAGALDEARSVGSVSPLQELSFSPVSGGSSSMRADGNNVDVDREMASLAENNIMYNALVQLAAKKMNMIEYAATDGRR